MTYQKIINRCKILRRHVNKDDGLCLLSVRHIRNIWEEKFMCKIFRICANVSPCIHYYGFFAFSDRTLPYSEEWEKERLELLDLIIEVCEEYISQGYTKTKK